jgi:hypothetical protein
MLTLFGLCGEPTFYYESLERSVPWEIYSKSEGLQRLAQEIIKMYQCNQLTTDPSSP